MLSRSWDGGLTTGRTPPAIELEYRPWAWAGPIFTLDYDRSIKGILHSNTGYERWELNGEYIHRINKLQSLQMRLGTGFYTWKDRRAYFLNYENFQENNIPGGWNDDLSGEFQLLRRETFNSSDYYIRANLTYVSPLLLLSWIPLAGHYVEMEASMSQHLDAKGYIPIRGGLRFHHRIMSVGTFFSNGRGKPHFRREVCFELFRHW